MDKKTLASSYLCILQSRTSCYTHMWWTRRLAKTENAIHSAAPIMVALVAFTTSVFSHFSGDWLVSRCVIIGISNGSADVANHTTIALVMGWPTEYVGVVSSCEDQSANSGVVGLMGQPTGYVGVMTSWLTVGWWGNGAADSGVVRLMGQRTGYIGVMTSQPTVKWWGNGSADSSVALAWLGHFQ